MARPCPSQEHGKDKSTSTLPASEPHKYNVSETESSSTTVKAWRSLLSDAHEHGAIGEQGLRAVEQNIARALEASFDSDFEVDLAQLLQCDCNELDDQIASEGRRLKRDERKTRKKEGLLEEEKERLQAFRPSRKAAEQAEAAELTEKLHPSAKQYKQTSTTSKSKLSASSASALISAKRDLDSREEALHSYQPETDDFLLDLAAQLRNRKKAGKGSSGAQVNEQ